MGVVMNELQSLLEFEKDNRWLHLNMSKLRREHADEFVAIKNEKIIDCSKDINDLFKKLEKRKEKPNEIVIEFVSKENLRLLL